MATRKAGVGFILVTLFLDIIGIGLVIPILPKLLGEFIQGESEASRWYGVFVAAYAAMQLVFSPILGSLSDRFGRRPVLITSLVGQGLDYLLLAFAPTLSWLFIGRVVAGITGASIGTATAYIADVSPPEKRAQNFGLIGMAFGLGFIAGPALGGFLGGMGLRVPFFVGAALTFANALYGAFILPESLAPENRRAFTWQRANPLGTLAALARYPIVLGLSAPLFLLFLAQRGLETTWVLYTSHRYGWSTNETGLSLAVVGIGAAVVQGGLVRKVVPRLGEKRSFIFGTLVAAIAFTGYGLATEGWMMFVILPFGSLAGIGFAAVQALLSRAVPANEQGMLQGGLGSLQSITQIIGPLVATSLFGFFISDAAPVKLPGASFFLGALLQLTGLLLALRIFTREGVPGAARTVGAGEAG